MSNFPNLPGFVPTQDIDVKTLKLERKLPKSECSETRVQQRCCRFILIQKNVQQTCYHLPREAAAQTFDQSKAMNPKYLTTNQFTYKPLIGDDANELFQPDWVKMDRQV